MKRILALLLAPCLFCLCACAAFPSKNEKSLRELSTVLLAPYTAECAFDVTVGDVRTEGTVRLSRGGTFTRLDMTSPEPYAGLSIEYDTAGAPSSIAVHFDGIDTTLPAGALSNVTRFASLATDDFAAFLGGLPGESVTELETADGKAENCASLVYRGADVQVCYADGVPLRVLYRGGVRYPGTPCGDGPGADWL